MALSLVRRVDSACTAATTDQAIFNGWPTLSFLLRASVDLIHPSNRWAGVRSKCQLHSQTPLCIHPSIKLKR